MNKNHWAVCGFPTAPRKNNWFPRSITSLHNNLASGISCSNAPVSDQASSSDKTTKGLNKDSVPDVAEKTQKPERGIKLGIEAYCKDESVGSNESTESWKYAKRAKKLKIGETSSTAESPLVNANVVSRDARQVSTELTLFDGSWTTKNPAFNSNMSRNKQPLFEEKFKRKGKDDNVDKMGCCGHKTLKDPWKIKKKLTASDCRLNRLMVGSALVRKYVLPSLSDDDAKEVESGGESTAFIVRDLDAYDEYKFFLKKWSRGLHWVRYYLSGEWTDLVKTRNLKEGDEIGINWDEAESRFNFCVLNRAPGKFY